MKNRTRHILERLDQVREDLLALSDDIWQSIDHNDTQALDEGVAFKREYNARMAAFDQLAGEISTLVQQFTAVRLNESDQADPRTPQAAERIIRDLDHRQAHGLNEDFTFKRPYGFQLGEEARSGVTTWRRLFELICLYLQGLDPQRFASLPGHPKFISRRGNPVFSDDPRALRSAMPLPNGLYAEANLSANHLCTQIGNLLDAFAIDRAALRLYLRQDRDAD